MCLIEGIKSNLKKLAGQNSFEVQQFIEGLKIHIKSFIEQNKIIGYEMILNKAGSLLDQIKQKTVNSKASSKGILPDSHLDLNSLINEFIGIYKDIISKG